MKVAVLTSSWPKHRSDPGGSFVLRSCEVLQRRGAELTVYPLEPGVELAGARVRALGPQLDEGQGGMLARLKRRPLLAAQIIERLLARQPNWRAADRVLSHWAVPFPLMAQAHGVPAERLRTWCHGSGLRLPGAGVALGRAHPIALVCEHQLRHVPIRFRQRTQVIPVPIDVQPEPTRPAEKKLVFVGRLVRQKGPDLIPEILNYLPGWRAVIVGAGPLRAPLEADERIECLGALPTEQWIRQVGGGVGICPARSAEGAPLVVDELRAIGLPVVVAAVDGLRQRVRHQQDGWIERSRNPKQWARAVQAAYDAAGHQKVRLDRRLGQAAWNRFSDWVLD